MALEGYFFLSSAKATLCIGRRPAVSRTTRDHPIQRQDIQHQLAERMIVVLAADVRLQGHPAVGEKHVSGWVPALLLPELLVDNLVCHSEILCRPLRAGSLQHVQSCDKHFILAPQALHIFILTREMQLLMGPWRGFDRPLIRGVIHVDPLRQSSVDVVPTDIEMVTDVSA